MKWIHSGNLKQWAIQNGRDCQETLPLLIKKLIRATTDRNSIQKLLFPSGDNISIGGWDGILELNKETEFLPKGISLWEIGTNTAIKGKADTDYEKRVDNSLGFNPSESNYIFVTPRIWKNEEKWVNEKKKEGVWKDVKVISAELLEEWIDIAPTVGAWLARHIGKYPDYVQPTDDFWNEWSKSSKYELIPELILGGREKEQSQLTQKISIPSITAIQSTSREESLAFIISAFKNEEELEEDFLARSLIAENVETFRKLSTHNQPLILIPRFEEDEVLHRAVEKGHTVFVPLGIDSSENWEEEKINLPRISRDGFTSALQKMGISREKSESLSKDSARNITILRRQLKFNRTIPSWATKENVNDIIPALLVGRWDENFENDKKIISEIAGESYEEYIKKISKWLFTNDSPILKIGNTWRLTSPLDAWTHTAKYLIKDDFNKLSNAVLHIFNEIDPSLELEAKERYLASLYGKEKTYSDWIRKGILQSLILTSLYGERLKLDTPKESEFWVDNVIRKTLNKRLLRSDNILLWKSFESELPLIAEASPSAFLDSIEYCLKNYESLFINLLTEDEGWMFPQTYHTGLLWALENLVWIPKYFYRSVFILVRMARLDKGGKIQNRPINSLHEIFKPWHYQTTATFKDRISVLKIISKNDKNIGWQILINMLPSYHNSTANFTHKTRWRNSDLDIPKAVTYKEIYETYSEVVDILIETFDNTQEKLIALIEVSVNLSPNDRKKLLVFIKTVLLKIEDNDLLIWRVLRHIIYHHQSNSDTDWALPKNELEPYSEFYQLLTPDKDNISWLFNDEFLEFPEHPEYVKMNSTQEKYIFIKKIRIERLKEFYERNGFDNVIQFSYEIKERNILGTILSFVLSKEDELKLYFLLEGNESDIKFVQSFLSSKYYDTKDFTSLFKRVKDLNLSNFSLINLFIALKPNKQLWNILKETNQEVIEGYWKSLYAYSYNFYDCSKEEKTYVINNLLNYDRSLSAMRICARFNEDISTSLIIKVLKKLGMEACNETQEQLDNHHINELLNILDNRKEIEEEELIILEWIYIKHLSSYGNRRKPIKLYNQLAISPNFFISILKCIYPPKDETEVEKIKEQFTDEQLKNRAFQAYNLLESWNKIPGVDEKGSIDYDFLKSWIDTSRELSKKYGKVDYTDIYIGKILAQYPENQGEIYPPEEICHIIEEINSNCLNLHYEVALSNKRSFTSRGSFDGGDIERGRFEYFNNLASQHRNKFPTITKIFENLANRYKRDSKRVDNDAERRDLEY